MKRSPSAILTCARQSRVVLLQAATPPPTNVFPSYSSTRRAFSIRNQRSVKPDGRVRLPAEGFADPFLPPLGGEVGDSESGPVQRVTARNDRDTTPQRHAAPQSIPSLHLPVSCPGCGALSQEVDSNEAGYYTRSRKAVKSYLHQLRRIKQAPTSDNVPQTSSLSTKLSQRVDKRAEDLAEHKPKEQPTSSPSGALPVCDRCHDLIYNARGVSISHPSMESLADSIAESPFLKNHVFHVLDAVDFPLSVIPSIYEHLHLVRPRTRNRRWQRKFSQRPTVSFIITRSDLIAPTKEQVDWLMPYFISVLRTALGRVGRGIRLGNVKMMSSKRGWWTQWIKEDIWDRGGGNWLVGKVNVGKSNLFEVLFPKDSNDRAVKYAEQKKQILSRIESFKVPAAPSSDKGFSLLPETSLLPPPQPETPFPSLPLVSSLPGTTASPIRLPFGNNKGELIDLPGLARGNLQNYILPEHKLDMVMTRRPSVKQHVIKAGQSLLLGGGVVRITPVIDLDVQEADAVVMAYPFVPVEAHVSATEKATLTQLQQRQSGIKSILAEGAGESIATAGKFTLDTNVTRARARAVMSAGIKLEMLPFRVFSTDILIEGMGWVELVCQVRRRRRTGMTDAESALPSAPLTPTNLGDAESDNHLPGGRDPPSGLQSSMSRSDASSLLETPPKASPAPPDVPLDTWHPPSGPRPDLPQMEEFPFPTVEIFSPEGKSIGKRVPMGAWMLSRQGKDSKTANAAIKASRTRTPMKGFKKREKRRRRGQ